MLFKYLINITIINFCSLKPGAVATVTTNITSQFTSLFPLNKIAASNVVKEGAQVANYFEHSKKGKPQNILCVSHIRILP